MTEQDPTAGGEIQGPPVPVSTAIEKTEDSVTIKEVETPESGYFFAGTQGLMARGFERTIQNDPNMGPTLETLISNYPLMSRDLAAGLMLSGQVNEIAPALLDALMERDRLAQEAAMASGFWQRTYGGLKATSRHLVLGAEDLYNSSPIFTVPRTVINHNQGRSWSEAWDQSTDSAAANAIMMSRLGFDIGYGSGFLPSEELVPTDEFFFAHVKEQILNGDFEGSAEEQLIAATQEAMISQIDRTGFNPYAMARQQWQSTQIHRTIGGIDYASPYSPGAAVVMPFTTPGTASYNMFSGLFDGIFRVTMEPIDIPMDYTGSMLRHVADPLVKSGLSGYRMRAMAQVLEEQWGIKVAREPIRIKHADFETAAKGATYPKIDPETGKSPVVVDPDRTDDANRMRLENMHKDDVWDLDGEFADYVRPYAEMGVKPSDVRRALDKNGGREAEFFLTAEHELHHVEQNKNWFGTFIDENGDEYVNYQDVKDAAPDEVKRWVGMMMDEKNSPTTIQKIIDSTNATIKRGQDLRAEADEIALLISKGDMSPPQRKAARREINDLEEQWEKALREEAAGKAEYDEAMAAYNTPLDEMQSFMESTAIKTAWKNMNDGTWQAPKMHKAAKRKAGLSNLMRPFIQAKDVATWAKSRVGQRTFRSLADLDNIEILRKRVPYLDERDIVKIADTNDPGLVQNIIQDAFEGGKMSATQRPTIGVFKDKMTRGADAWRTSTTFVGGPVGKARTAMGRYGTRQLTSVGNTLLSQVDLPQTLDTINSSLATVGASRAEINKVQRMAINGHGRHTTIDNVYNEIEKISKRRLSEQSGGLYSKAELDDMWAEWRGYDVVNRHYWTSNAGKDRNWIFQNGKFRELTPLERGDLRPEAFMEAQFSETTRSVPPIRSIRRLNSQQRRSYEIVKKVFKNRPEGVEGWKPLGYRPTGIMDFGDWSFGIWRDLQLMRGGWAMRILPEEQLRFGAAGFANIFSHPIDYFITMLNKMEFTVMGDDLTLDQILRTQEALGTGGLRDLRSPPHVVRGENFDIAHRVQHPRQFWGGMTREYVMSSSDPVVSRVARMGPEEAHTFFKTDEGKKILTDIANKASAGSSTARIIRPEELQRYLDVVELRIQQITGGDGLWHNPATGEWVDAMDVPKAKASDKAVYRNEADLHAAMVDAADGDTDVLIGMTHRSRADLEAALNELRGYNLDELEEAGRSAVTTKRGNDDLRKLLADRQLDEIKIDGKMSYSDLRKMDEQLETAFNSREAIPPESWPVARGELENPDQRNFRNKATDQFFLWFNAIPSQVLNRQPFFQQSFGVKMAEAYYYGDTQLRGVIDELRGMNESFKISFDVGQRKLFRDMDVNDWASPFDTIDRRPKVIHVDSSETPTWVYDEAAEAGRYDIVPGEDGIPKRVFREPEKVSFDEWAFTFKTDRADHTARLAKRYGVSNDWIRATAMNKTVTPARLEKINPSLHDDFVKDIEAFQTFTGSKVMRVDGEATPEALEAARRFGWQGPDPTPTFDPSSTMMAEYQEEVNRGLYDRIPLSDDPNEFVTQKIMESMELEGYVEGVRTAKKGVYAYRYGETSARTTGPDYPRFKNRVFSSTKRHRPLNDWLTFNEQYGVRGKSDIAESGTRLVAEKYGLHEDVYRNLISSDLPIRESEVMRAIDDHLVETFVKRIEAERVLRRHYDGEIIPDDELSDAAVGVGWGRDKHSGGVSLGPERGLQHYYGDYVDVFPEEAFGDELQEIMKREGDLEQLYFISKERTPLLHAMDEDIIRIWNDVRERTMFRPTFVTYRELNQENKKVLAWLTMIEDELGFDLLSNPAPIEELSHMAYRDPLRVEIVKEWINESVAREGDKWLHDFRAFANETFIPPSQVNRQHAGIDVEAILTLFDDTFSDNTRSMNISQAGGSEKFIRQLLEQEMGRPFTTPQWDELTNAFQERLDYLPSEIVLHNTPIQPSGRFHRESMLANIEQFNIVFDTPKEMGHFALLLQANTELMGPYQAARTGPKVEVMTYRSFLPSRSHTTAPLTADEGWDQWIDFVMRGVDKDGIAKWERTLEQLKPDGYLVLDSYDGSLAPAKDYALWIQSDQFQQFVISAEDTARAQYDKLKMYLMQQAARKGGLDPHQLKNSKHFENMVATWIELEEAQMLVSAGSLEHMKPPLDERHYQDMLDSAVEAFAEIPNDLFVMATDVSKAMTEDLKQYHAGASLLNIATDKKTFYINDTDPMTGYKLGQRRPTDEALRGNIVTNFDNVSQENRNLAAQQILNVPDDGIQYDQMEAGRSVAYKNSSPGAVRELDELMMAAKRDSIQETKDLFYDLSNKSNVADALKFIFPFGDAWYEVLSRWAKIQNPWQSGGQSFRNVRRLQQTLNAGQQSGFISTNEYGEEVFNWNISAGSVINSFIPTEANVRLQGKMPISSLMFIDPTARGIMSPGVSPVVQLTAQVTQPDTTNIPLFSEAMSWLAYGGKEEYRPGEVNDFADVPQGFFPTVFNRLVSAAFDEQARDTMGNTKLRLFESIGISGDPEYNIMTNPANAVKAWDLANTAGSWLGWLRVLDAWFLPGQPQYAPEMKFPNPDLDTQPGQTMTLEEVIFEASNLSSETQYRITSIIRANAEYRSARELWGDAEADMFMLERYGILPAILQPASVGLVERPVSWGGVEWVDDNDWVQENAPLTLAWMVPPDVDDTFSSRAWNNQFGEYMTFEGVENQPIRRKKSPSEITQSIQRGMGYDQVRHQTVQLERSVDELRKQYGAGYASDPSYRAQKKELDRIYRNNVEIIYTQYPIVRPSNQGDLVGAPQGITTRRYVDEVLELGTPGTTQNQAIRSNAPEIAVVAEQYADWLKKMEAFSRVMDDGKASGEWWANSTSPNAQILQIALAKQVQTYYRSLTPGSHAQSYAGKMNERLLDPLINNWEWIDSAWSAELEAFPSIEFNNIFGPEETP